MNTLKILAIGNSFSQDGMCHLYKLAESCGFKNIILGNLFIGGCSLERHYNNAIGNLCEYSYEKNTAGKWEHTPSTLIDGILDEEWDYITLQQVSSCSGIIDTFQPYLDYLIDYVNKNKRNKNAKLLWHMTWAYPQTSKSVAFKEYNNDESTMYSRIVDIAENYITSLRKFDGIIPSGTAIQNIRTTYLRGTENRDDIHLSQNIGRVTAGLTWLKYITGCDISSADIGADLYGEPFQLCIKAANAAVKEPYKVTEI